MVASTYLTTALILLLGSTVTAAPSAQGIPAKWVCGDVPGLCKAKECNGLNDPDGREGLSLPERL
jgi:hypothetical protein